MGESKKIKAIPILVNIVIVFIESNDFRFFLSYPRLNFANLVISAS